MCSAILKILAKCENFQLASFWIASQITAIEIGYGTLPIRSNTEEYMRNYLLLKVYIHVKYLIRNLKTPNQII